MKEEILRKCKKYVLSQNLTLFYCINIILLFEYWIFSWSQPIPHIIEATQENLIMGCAAYDSYEEEGFIDFHPSLIWYYSDPIDWQIPNFENNKIIVLGDSIHPMCPFKGIRS